MPQFAWLNVHCTATTGEVGCFLTAGPGSADRVPITPVWRDLVQAFDWMRLNGWALAEHDGAAFIPWRVTKSA